MCLLICNVEDVKLNERKVLEKHWRNLKQFRSLCVFTDGAVFAIPALLTLTLAIPAGPVFHTLWVTQSLVTACACPALLTVANTSNTHPMTATI